MLLTLWQRYAAPPPNITNCKLRWTKGFNRFSTAFPIIAMGYHYGLFSRFDAQLVLDEPEVLVYAQGHQKLAAVEYIIPAAAWTSTEPPTFLGKTLQLKNTVGPYSADPYWELHVWVWRHNKTDMYADWNPQVSCEHEH